MKWDWNVRMFATTTAAFSTVSHELHRIRRGVLAPFFSKSSVQQLQPVVRSIVDKMISRLQALRGSGTNVNLIDLYACLTGDIISQYAFARSYNLLDSPDFAPHWNALWMGTGRNGHIVKQFGWLVPMMRRMPAWVVKLVAPDTLRIFNMQTVMNSVSCLSSQANSPKELFNQIIEIQTELKENRKMAGQKTIFSDVLMNEHIRPEEKTAPHLTGEAQSVVAAGTITTAHILSILTYHVIRDPTILERLQSELGTVMSEAQPSPKWQQLDQLPFLVRSYHSH